MIGDLTDASSSSDVSDDEDALPHGLAQMRRHLRQARDVGVCHANFLSVRYMFYLIDCEVLGFEAPGCPGAQVPAQERGGIVCGAVVISTGSGGWTEPTD